MKKGDIVSITFKDHVAGDDQLLVFTVYGKIAKIDEEKIVVHSWHYANKLGDSKDHNVTSYAIIRDVIIKITVLKEEKV